MAKPSPSLCLPISSRPLCRRSRPVVINQPPNEVEAPRPRRRCQRFIIVFSFSRSTFPHGFGCHLVEKKISCGILQPMRARELDEFDDQVRLSAREMSEIVDFSASDTLTPPIPKKPPSLDASATAWLTVRSHSLNGLASPGALRSSSVDSWPRAVIALVLISAESFAPPSIFRRPSRAPLVSSKLVEEATTALMSSLALGSAFAFASALALAKASFILPNKPDGSAAVTAKPDKNTPCSIWFHSSVVKSDLPVIGVLPCGFQYSVTWLATIAQPRLLLRLG